jgi:coenzyme Q-binding protein COQ10
MTTHRESRVVPYTADLMYAIVADVEKYPEFLPWVVALRVISRERVETREIVFAEMAVGFSALRERYTSRVVLDRAAFSVDVVQTEGPFRVLENHWRFVPMETSCRIEFSITFEFKSRILNAVAGSAFERVVERMTSAFEARAMALSKQAVQ